MKKVITYGTFDLFHQGHYNLLKRAKALGDYLIVGVTSDYFDKSRGKFNVHDSLMTRVKNVEATGFADQIVVEEYFGQKIDDIKKYNVDVFTVGSDWEGHFDYLNEYCKVIYLERTKGISSTQIRNLHSIRLGIIGDEQILDRFLTELNFVSGIEPWGIYSIQNDVLIKYKSTHAKTLPQYKSCKALLSDVDAVYINAPLNKRAYYIKMALLANKHVLTEFPFCDNYKDAKDLIKLAFQRRLVLNEALKTAYCPAFGKMISLIKSGHIGKVLSIEANFTQILGADISNQVRIAGGSLFSLGAYPLLAIFKLLGHDFNDIHFFSHKENNIDTITRINIIYPTAIATALVAINAKAEGNLIVSGTQGYVYVPAPWWKTEYYEVRYENINRNTKYFYKFEGEGLRYEIVEFVRNIQDNQIDNLLLTKSDMLAECKVFSIYNNNNMITYF